MPFIYLHLLLIALVTALACVLPGTFLLLRGNALICDALSHAILFGIVITFLIVRNIKSPIIFFGAVISGLATAYLTEQLAGNKKIDHDAAIGLIFPFLFSIAVLCINLFAHNVHLDTDAVLLGELIFAPLDTWYYQGYNLGPCALWNMTVILFCNALCIWYFFKELQLITFDPVYAASLGLRPKMFEYLIMTLTTITILQAFYVTGSILVISLMITPCATAFLLTYNIKQMITLSCLLAIIATLAGFLLAHMLDSSIAGSISCMNGLLFCMTLIGQQKRPT